MVSITTQANIKVSGSPASSPTKLRAVIAIAPAQESGDDGKKLRVESVRITAVQSVTRETAYGQFS